MAKDVTPPTTMPTLGLCVITDTVDRTLQRKLNFLRPAFNAIYVQVNGGEGFGYAPMEPDIQVSKFEWGDDFAAARNALLKEVTTDYWCWMDADDELEHPEKLKVIARHMAETGVDMVYAPYEYATNEAGVVTELQNRERIIRTNLAGAWHGIVHETWIPETDAQRETTKLVTWVHRPAKDHFKKSMLRNRRILEAEAKKEPVDPRTWYYLGLNYGQDGHYTEAIQAFYQLVQTSGWDEEIYRAWLQIFSCQFELGDYEQAEMAAFRAMSVLPDWPDACFMLQQLYYQTDQHAKALEWYQTGLAKPDPESDSAFNPIVRHYQPKELAIYSYLATGQPLQARRTLQVLQIQGPHYAIKEALRAEVDRAVATFMAINATKTLLPYAADPQAVLQALPSEIRADIRLTEARRKYIPGKKWPKGSIVFYCGPSFEEWGPDTLDQGMGGSEEAVIYLSRALVDKFGGTITVYNERTEGILDYDAAIQYRPWTEVNPNDEFDVFVAWRSPAGIENIKARKKLVDLHDIIAQETVYAAIPHVDKFLFKSHFHRSLYPEVPDKKAVVIGNGIVPEQFV